MALAGCGAPETPPAAVLRIANWSGPANDANFLALERAHRARFEAAHPGVRLELEQIPGLGQFEPKVLLQIAAGNAPDVIQLDASSAAVFIENDALLDLTPFIEADESFRAADYFDAVYDVTRRGAAQFGVPLDFTPMVLVYNRALFDEAGVPYPREDWNWSDFRQTAMALSRPADGDRPRQFGFRFVNHMPFWVMWLWNNGADAVSPDGRAAEGYFDGPAALEAMQFLVDLARVDRSMATPLDEKIAGVDLFRSGRAAMHVTGHWELIEYRHDKLSIGVAPLPSDVGRSQTVIYASSMAILRDARQPRLAWEYLKFLTSTQTQIERVASGVAISANRAAAEHYADDLIERAFLARLPEARAPTGARVERYSQCEELGREMFDDVFNGGLALDEAARVAARRMDALLRD